MSLLLLATIALGGCLDTLEEITLNEDGTGVFNATTDMSKLIGLAKQLGGADAMKGLEKPVDTSFALQSLFEKDSTMTEVEKSYLKDGTFKANTNMKDEKLVIGMNIPFKKTDDITELRRLSGKMMNDKLFAPLKESMGSVPGLDDQLKPSSFDDYFEIIYSKGLIVKKLNKDKYSSVGNDGYLKNMKEASAMGMGMTSRYVINLPRPATKVEGKSVKLSDDKRKVTVVATVDDFFDSPANLEYKIEY
ncbi:MAG TPA: hypothetical protein VF476_12755 [Chitinophagaceae bacterium]